MKTKLIALLLLLTVGTEAQVLNLNDSVSNLRRSINKLNYINIKVGTASELPGHLSDYYYTYGINGQYKIKNVTIGFDFPVNRIQSTGEVNSSFNKWDDYLDKIYIEYGDANSSFYIKTGKLERVHLGYSNIVNGLSNRLNYPLNNSWGIATSYKFKNISMDLFINDLADVFKPTASPFIASRVEKKLSDKLKIGFTAASDLNEYDSFKDSDKDAYTDEFDLYPEDGRYVTEYEKAFDLANGNLDYLNFMVEFHGLSTTQRKDIKQLGNKHSISAAFGIDITYSLLQKPKYNLELYSHISKMMNYGWGIAIPGIKASYGKKNKIAINMDYAYASEEFIFGFYDYDYLLSRAYIISRGLGQENLDIVTKQSELSSYPSGSAINFGLSIEFNDFIELNTRFSKNWWNSTSFTLINSELALNKDFGKNINFKITAFLETSNIKNLSNVTIPLNGLTISVRLNKFAFGFEQHSYFYTDHNWETDKYVKGGLTALGLTYFIN
ncbi:MAG TPA: hypothetical protein DCQ31_11505 [Bacteroidales bacterium]|nr:hypothetical protein [Bacteroidales bacterium]